jgi:hypothetical protein
VVPHLREVLLLALLFAAPFVVAVLAQPAGSPPQSMDVALIELRTSDVAGHLPLVGSYERQGGNQPGPWLFYALALPHALFGPVGLAVGAALIGWSSVLGMLVVADRRGGRPLLLWVALLVGVLIAGRGGAALADPWEPHVALLVLALLALLVWEGAVGSLWALVVAVALGSFLAGAWLVLGPTVAALAIVAAVAVVRRAPGMWRDVEGAGRRTLLWCAATAGVIAAVMWLPPLVEQLVEEPGNLAGLFGVAGEGAAVGLGQGSRAVALQLGVWPIWAGRDVPTTLVSGVDASTWTVPVALLAWVGAAFWTRHRLNRGLGDSRLGGDLLWLHAVVAAVVVSSVVALSVVPDFLAVWLVEPSRLVGMMCWLAAGCSVVAGWARPDVGSVRAGGAGHTVGAGGVMTLLGWAGVVALVVVASVDATSDEGRSPLTPAFVELAGDAADALGDEDTPVLVGSEASASIVFGSEGVGTAELAALLEREGVETRVQAPWENRFGPHRGRPETALTELRLRSEPGPPEGSGWVLVSESDPMTARQRQQRAELDRRVDEVSGGLTGAELLQAAAEDDELRPLVEEQLDSPLQPVLYLWRRTLP